MSENLKICVTLNIQKAYQCVTMSCTAGTLYKYFQLTLLQL